jgi:hypothetical protein
VGEWVCLSVCVSERDGFKDVIGVDKYKYKGKATKDESKGVYCIKY